METIWSPQAEPAQERLAGEFADVQASIELVASGMASRITLTGLRFGRMLAEQLGAAAESAGVELETSIWPEEDSSDISVRRKTHA